MQVVALGSFQACVWVVGAKTGQVSLLSLALFVLECYHTGIHLFAGGITADIKRSIPAGTPLGPPTLQKALHRPETHEKSCSFLDAT